MTAGHHSMTTSRHGPALESNDGYTKAQGSSWKPWAFVSSGLEGSPMLCINKGNLGGMLRKPEDL